MKTAPHRAIQSIIAAFFLIVVMCTFCGCSRKTEPSQLPWLIGAVVPALAVLALASILFYRSRKLQVERAVMHESEERIQLLLNSTPLAVNLIDKNFQTIMVNEEALRMFGLKSEQEYIERIFKDLSPKYQPDGILSDEKGFVLMKEAFETGSARFMWMHQGPNQEPFPCEVRFVRLKYKDDYVLAGYARDLREEKKMLDDIRKTTEEILTIEEARQHLKTILDILPVGIIIMSRIDGALLYANNAGLGVFNCKSFEEDVAGRKSFDFMPEIQPDGKKTVDLVAEIRNMSEAAMEIYCKKLTGEIFLARLAFCIINYNGVTASLNVIEDMTTEREHQQMLLNTALKEQEANQLKSRFLAKMSHEIRTPMNAIIGMTELALREKTPASKNEHIFTVKQAASNLLAIINDILDLSKIEAGKMEIIPAEYSSASLLSDIVSIIRMRVLDSQLRFTVKADSKIPHILYGDETRIRQAVLNILSNAVKYTENGFVSFAVYADFKDSSTVNIIFEVEDSGIGIRQKDIGKLFTDFTQLDLERNQGIEGVGLGLAITKNIVNAMGGNITVQSKYGRGSTFTITVPQKYHCAEPLAKIEKPEEKKVLILVYERRDLSADSISYTLSNLGVDFTIISRGTELYEEMEMREYNYLFIPFSLYKKNEDTIRKFGVKTKVVILIEFGETVPEKGIDILTMPLYCTQIADIFNGVYNSQTYTANNESIVKFRAPDAKVLIVDDINTNLKVAEGLLAPYNMHIDLCNSGKAAIEAVQSERYDLVFMDHRMPGMDGVETTKRIRNLEDIHQPPVPIIALTANAIFGMVEMFLENGFNDFLPKPIDTVQLNAILEKWIPKEKQVKI